MSEQEQNVSEQWVDLEHPVTGGTTRVPNTAGVVDSYTGRGWQVSEEQSADPDMTEAQLRLLEADRLAEQDAAEQRSAAAKRAAKTRKANAEQAEQEQVEVQQDQSDSAEASATEPKE